MCLLDLPFPLTIHLLHYLLAHPWSAEHVDLIHELGEETYHQVLPEMHRFMDTDLVEDEDVGELKESGKGKDECEIQQHLDQVVAQVMMMHGYGAQ